MKDDFFSELIEKIKLGNPDKQQLHHLKTELCKKHKINEIPTDIEILTHAENKDLPLLQKKILTKPTRTISGVAVVAVMTKPFKCPHGKCIYCPGGINSEFGTVPQSYTGNEPATMRAIRANYDPYMQVFNRLEQYIVMGHNPEKVELIVMGGTFPSFPKSYKNEFIKYLFKAMNDFSKLFYKNENFDFMKFKKFFELPGKVGDSERTRKIQAKLNKLKGKCSLESEQKTNEKSKIRCIGLTIETRPDYANLKLANEMLSFGCTRVELGVQSVFDEVLKKAERGHDVKTTIEATRTLKDLGFKINYHYMPGLPGSSEKLDLEGFKKLFSDENFKPDMLKIYPCMVMKGTKLYDLWKDGKYTALTTERAAKIITEFKKIVPEYCRIMRVQRDIPTKHSAAGVGMTNLRQLIKSRGARCRCIRCREIRNEKIDNYAINVYRYKASGGEEFFIAAENNVLLGFCRLRFPSQSLRKEITKYSALIRELHVYGSAAGIGEDGAVQHKGIGKRLLEMAERMAYLNNRKKIVIISGIGVREYYKKLGYKKEGAYMVKSN